MKEILTNLLLAASLAMASVCGAIQFALSIRDVAKSCAKLRASIAAVMIALAVVCTGIAQKRGETGEVGEWVSGGVEEVGRVEQVERGEVGKYAGDDGRALSPRAPYSEPIPGESPVVATPYGALGESALPDAATNRGAGMSDAERVTRNWNRHGARDDSFWIDFDNGFVFPHGDGHLGGLEVLACGETWPTPFDTNAVARLPHPLAIVAGQSSFSWEHTASNSYLFSWHNCHVQGSTNDYVSASIELRRNGDIRTVYDGVESHFSRVPPFPGVGIGQGEAWVSDNFENAVEILSVGYAQWVDAQVGYGVTNGLYKLTVSFADDPPEATLVTLGGYAVVATNAGDYVFLLEKGTLYEGQITPLCGGVTVSAADDLASPERGRSGQAGGTVWTWTEDGGQSSFSYLPESGAISALWLPTLRGSPEIGMSHVGPDDELPTLEAILDDYAGTASFAWTGSGVEFSSPNGRTTDATITDMPGCGNLSIGVSATIGGYTLHSYLNGVTYGEHAVPEVSCGVYVQPHLIRRDKWMAGSVSAPLTVSFASDVPTNAHFRAWIASGGEKVELSEPLPSFDVSESMGVERLCFLDGIATSDSEGDVVICCTLADSSIGIIASNSTTVTVVTPTLVSVPSAPSTGLAVLIGSQVGATLDLGVQATGLDTRWYTARRKTQSQYDPWAYRGAGSPNVTLTMDQAGIFALKARTICGCQSNEVEYVHLVDEPYVAAVQEAQGPCKTGMKNHIGVSSTTVLLSIRNQAVAHLGLPEYGYEHSLPSRNGFSSAGRRTWKCNFFVADIAIAGGYSVPGTRVITHGLFPSSVYPPTANDWSDGVTIPGWRFIGTDCYPEPGFVAAHLGHCGIVDYDGWTISARTHGISRSARTMLKPTRTYSKPEE